LPRILGLIVVLVLGAQASTACAQWNPRMTASLGRSYGQLALSQSVLSGTRRAGEAAAREAPPSNDPDAAFTFTPDPELTSEIRAGVIDLLSQQSPQFRWQMEQTFADDVVLKDFDKYMRSHGGYSPHNVADCMAALLVISWEIITNETANDAQIRGANLQVRGIFLNTPRLKQMTNAERQEMAEKSAYQVMIAKTAREQYQRQPDRRALKELQASANTVMQQQGIDLSQLTLTAEGFHKS
jgi:uncharacterized protein DUF6683